MKKDYFKPDICITFCGAEDVIRTSDLKGRLDSGEGDFYDVSKYFYIE